jgi:hypothetical protein
VDEVSSYIQFLVPSSLEARLTRFLADLEVRREELGVTDVQIGLTSLEEVFLNIARKVRAGGAEAGGKGSALRVRQHHQQHYWNE